MGKLQNPTDNKGYMPLKRHIASTVRQNEHTLGRLKKRMKKIRNKTTPRQLSPIWVQLKLESANRPLPPLHRQNIHIGFSFNTS
ncbi:hypothetical protein A2291_04745 [candidate division WOR-1 bacterium RIFOXYB2_FULL_42_35]|nr:MAG: hypothetical protein A2247_02890 [candidate division WOR-1 bacterium RIFOXYA2_FULL_41_14]OGC25318.1 MAG: hypothetical protein A2291_04745 [candidate division WOR-1 bacterium RIFOXYB2_FULL_42_35]